MINLHRVIRQVYAAHGLAFAMSTGTVPSERELRAAGLVRWMSRSAAGPTAR